MASNYPTGLDSFDPVPRNQALAVKHHDRHQNVEDAIEAVEAYLGVTGSTVPTSITYLLNNLINNGASVLPFLQLGTGSTPRSLQNRMRDTISALDYSGVDPTGIADSAPGINAALTYAKSVGKSVFLPAGIYRTASQITVPGGTELVGEGWQPYTAYATTATLGKGTIIHVNHTGVGLLVQKDGVNRTSGVKISNLAMYWNHAVPGPGWVPTVYDWAIKVDRADDVTVEDVLMVNPYKGIQITGTALEPAGRLNLSRVFGQPLLQGVEIDLSVDVSSLDRVHFWPFWSDNANVLSWMKANNASFLKSNRSDNTELTNIFGYGYKYGIWLSSNAVGVTQRMRGQGIDFDDTVRAFWCDSSGDVSSGSFTNFNATANPATAGADLFVSEGDGVDFNFANLRLSNSQQSTMLVTGVNARVRAVNVFADQWNIALGGSAAFNAGAGVTLDIVNHRFGTSNGGPMVGGPGTININEWINYTPTISAGAGTITTATTSGKYRRTNKKTEVLIDSSITNNGTGATSVIFSLPFQASAFPVTLVGREYNATGSLVSGEIVPNATQIVCKTYNNGYPGGAATKISVGGTYESV